jgi:uncharacterized membrane protein YedE/YeeE
MTMMQALRFSVWLVVMVVVCVALMLYGMGRLTGVMGHFSPRL